MSRDPGHPRRSAWFPERPAPVFRRARYRYPKPPPQVGCPALPQHPRPPARFPAYPRPGDLSARHKSRPIRGQAVPRLRRVHHNAPGFSGFFRTRQKGKGGPRRIRFILLSGVPRHPAPPPALLYPFGKHDICLGIRIEIPQGFTGSGPGFVSPVTRPVPDRPPAYVRRVSCGVPRPPMGVPRSYDKDMWLSGIT
jgi:hypothetical protein